MDEPFKSVSAVKRRKRKRPPPPTGPKFGVSELERRKDLFGDAFRECLLAADHLRECHENYVALHATRSSFDVVFARIDKSTGFGLDVGDAKYAASLALWKAERPIGRHYLPWVNACVADQRPLAAIGRDICIERGRPVPDVRACERQAVFYIERGLLELAKELSLFGRRP